MIPRRLLATFIFALPVLTVLFMVTSMGYFITTAGQDDQTAAVLKAICLAISILIVSDVILLVGAIGVSFLIVTSGESAQNEVGSRRPSTSESDRDHD